MARWCVHGRPAPGWPEPSSSPRRDRSDRAGNRAVPIGGPSRGGQRLAVGFILFAAMLMIMAGAFQAFAGLVAIVDNEFYVATRNYLFQFDATTWGWIHLLVGLIMVMAGFAILAGRTWGRVVGITLAMLSALANFLFIPYYPFWALTIITLDIFVSWALAAHGRDVAA